MNAQDVKLNTFSEIDSRVIDLPAGKVLLDAIREYEYVVQYTYDGVEILNASSYDILPDGFLELRAFNKSGEIHVIDIDGELRGRVRVDGEGSKSVVFDEEHLLWGSRLLGQVDGSLALVEDRGMMMRFPAEVLRDYASGKDVVTLLVRNYLDEEVEDTESGDTRFSFADFRFVGFNVREGD